MKLSDYMDFKKLSDDDMAEKTSVHRSTISRVRRGETRPSWSLIAKLRETTQGLVKAEDFE